MKRRPVKLSFLVLASMFYTMQIVAQNDLPAAYSSNLPRNYVRTWDASKPALNVQTISSELLKDVRQTTAYYDGLGRPLQTVVKQGSLETSTGVNSDMVIASIYNQYGREVDKYLPFPASNYGGNTSISDGLFKLNPFQQQVNFYNTQLSGQPGETNVGASSLNFAYSESSFEMSPINRVKENFAPGVSWSGSTGQANEVDRHSVKSKQWVNTATDDVKIWNVTDVTNGWGTYATTASYPAGTLFKNISQDERNSQVIEFKDKEGKMILKKMQLTATSDNGTGSGYSGWLCTYYLYDIFDNLRCVIQPKGVELISPNWSLSDPTILAQQCFRYEYDPRNRMTRKQVPGAGETWMVYDARDRLVMTQDANLRSAQKWMYTVYDNNLNRPVSTGLMTDNSNYNNLGYHLQNAYSSSSYPTIANYTTEELTVVFYDDYSWLSNYGNPLPSVYNSTYNSYFQATSNTTWPYPQSNIQSALLRGRTTGSRTKIIGTSTYLYSVYFYDEKARVIQTQNTNVTGGVDIITNQYSWAGQPLVVIQKQEKAGAPAQTSTVITQLTYDDLGRVIKTEKKIANTLVNSGAMPGTFKVTAQLQYDKLSQLKTKILSPTGGNGGGPLETLTYDYNIRGWMLGTNRDYAKASSNTSNYFGFDLGYDKNGILPTGGSSIGTFSQATYNGNISGTVWKTKGDNEIRKYDFSYDNENRLTAADFNQYTSSAFNKSALVDFSVSNLTFDANGNILSMNQTGLKLNTSSAIDQLTYTYQTNSNKLSQVSDAVNDNTSKLGDFKYDASAKTFTDYSYDVNGNLTVDNNKKISDITYNHLNLPSIITVTGKGNITYTYDAAGNKLKKVTVDNSTSGKTITTTTSYIAGFVYESKTISPTDANNPDYTDVLQFTGHEEGRIRFKTTTNTLAYDYFLKDHLGNVRMVLTDDVQQDFYPAATLEGTTSTGALPVEQKYYDINTAQITDNSAISGITTYQNNNGISNPNPQGNSSANSAKMYKLNSSSVKTGLGLTLKVMAGDVLNIFGKSYYMQSNSGGTSVNANLVALDIITALLVSPTGAAAGKGTATQITSNTSGTTTPLNSFLSNNHVPAASTVPKAFINYILLDDQFKYVSGGASPVNSSAYTLKDHYSELQNIAVTKNGYLYVYCSNESPVDVFFDNLQVVHNRGAVLEETHYYPFGLIMAGISSKAAGGTENKYKYNKGSELQNKEFSDGSGLELYATNFRSLDPQLGRFWQIDPKPDYSQSMYSSMNNNPISFNDPLGDTVRHSFRTGFLGIFGKKATVDYANGKYYNSGTNTEYTGKTRSYQKALLGDLTTLSNNTTTSSMMGGLVSSSQVVQIKNGGSSENGGASFEAASAVANPGKDLVVNYSVGKSYSTNDVNQGGASGKIPGFVALAHEFAHVQDYLTNGKTNFLSSNGWYTSSIIPGRVVGRTEIFATDVENRLRANLGLPLREFYSADKATGTYEGRILNAGTRTNANINFINGGTDALGNLIPISY